MGAQRSRIIGFRVFCAAFIPHHLYLLPATSTMDPTSQRSKGQDRTISALNGAIEILNLAKEAASATPAKAVFGSVSILLTIIRVGLPPIHHVG